MPFPSYSEYIDQINTALDKYKRLKPVKKANGDLYFSTGNFGVVLKMVDPATQKQYGIKCFTRDKQDLIQRYKAISDYLKSQTTSYLIPLEFLENELYIDSTLTDENEFPALIMPWIEGLPLNNAIKQACDTQNTAVLKKIYLQFLDLCIWLLAQPIAHTDLKPDNILFDQANNKMVLVDYDGMFVPSFTKQAQAEGGTSGYIHPDRPTQEFDQHLDDFSILILTLSLQMLVLDSTLLEKYSNDTNLLFTQTDYKHFTQSAIYTEITRLKNQFPALGILGELLNYTLSTKTAQIPMLRNMLQELKQHTQTKQEAITKETLEAWYENLDYFWQYRLNQKGISKTTIEEILKIRKFETDDNIENLDGLEYAIALEELYLTGSLELRDITALKRCKKLKKIKLSYTNITFNNDCNEIDDYYNGANLDSLEGLENASELEVLILGANESLRDLTPLKGCKKLKKLNLSGCKLKTLDGLENATELEELNLGDNENLRDFSALKGCKNLKQLYLFDCKLETLDGLENAIALEKLYLWGNKNLRDFTALKRCENLKKLDLSNCNLETLNGLENVIELEELGLGGNENIKDFTALKNCKKLKKIYLSEKSWDNVENEIIYTCFNLETLKGFEYAKELEEMDLAGNKKLRDISALKFCKKLKKINLDFCNLETLNGLENATELEELDLSFGNKNLSDITALKGCKNLKKLDLSNCLLETLDGLENATELEELDLRGNNIKDFSALKGCENLKKINLSYCNLENLNGLENAKELEMLYLGGNENIRNFSALKWCEKLNYISLSNCNLETLDGIENATALEELYLGDNKNLRDFSALKGCKNLKQLYLYDCNLETLDGLENATELEELDLRYNGNLKDISALKSLKNLKKIYMTWGGKNSISKLEGYENIRDIIE